MKNFALLYLLAFASCLNAKPSTPRPVALVSRLSVYDSRSREIVEDKWERIGPTKIRHTITYRDGRVVPFVFTLPELAK